MLERFSLLFFFLKMYYIHDHYCYHTSSDSGAFDRNNLGQCISHKTTRMNMRLRIARLVYDHQLQIREYLGIDESEALIQFKFVVS